MNSECKFAFRNKDIDGGINMAIPKLNKQDIIDALKYINENGIPHHNQSSKYELVTEDGKPDIMRC